MIFLRIFLLKFIPDSRLSGIICITLEHIFVIFNITLWSIISVIVYIYIKLDNNLKDKLNKCYLTYKYSDTCLKSLKCILLTLYITRQSGVCYISPRGDPYVRLRLG
jgi:hypothetical protein